MRGRRAKKHRLTIYEMVRRPDLYLPNSILIHDMILERNPANLPQLIDDCQQKTRLSLLGRLRIGLP